MRFKVDNMVCAHCAHTVTRAIQRLDRDARVDVDLARGLVSIDSGQTSEQIIAALAAEHYPAHRLAD